MFVYYPLRLLGIPSHVVSVFVATIRMAVLIKKATNSFVIIEVFSAVLFLYLSKEAKALISIYITALIMEITIEIAMVSRKIQIVFQNQLLHFA